MRSPLRGAFRLALLLVATSCVSQTFDVNGHSSDTSKAPARKQHPQQSTRGETSMGWGSGIEVAREARAAQTALEHGDYKGATAHAQRAVNFAPQNADLWFTLAYAARLSGQYSLSVDSYQKGLALKPSSVQGLSGLAQTYARMGRSAEAQQTLDKVLAANPRSDQDLQLAGELLLTTDPKRATGYLQRAEEVKPSARTELLLARAYDRSGDSESAHNMLDRARRSAPNNPDVVRAVASYYRDTGHYDEAVKVLESLRTKDVTTLAELGYSYQLAGDPPAAARNYSEAANRAPRDVNIQLSAAQSMLIAGDFTQATALLNRAAAIDPENYRLFALRGRLDASEHRTADAIHEYENALQHLPAEGIAEGVLYPVSLRLDLAEVYRDAGDDANAQRVTKDAAAQINAINLEGAARPEFLRLRAVIELDQGNADAAEKDLQQAIQLEPKNVILLLNYANLLRKTDRKQEAQKTYEHALAMEPSNASALGALGFLSREMGNYDEARRYFLELEKKHPDEYVGYLALGDLDSETRHFDEAQQSYEKAFAKAPENPLIVAGAINAALEAHHLPVAKRWIAGASEAVRQNPQVMRENERYLTITGDYAASADLGYQVIEKLPNDREGVDYLAYDLLFLNRFDEAMKIVERYEPILPKDRDLPLIAGHVHASRGDREAAIHDFTVALQIDPTIAVGYMNRGYVYNDMRLASKAEQDFRKALELNPQYGEAHLGLAFALVQLRRSSQALKEADLAARLLPDSESVHLVKAEAFRQRAIIASAEAEYKKALKINPKNVNTYITLADVQYRGHRYADSADTLRGALAVVPDDSMVMAELARSYAKLGRADDAMQAITTAQRTGGKDYKVLLVTAEALRLLNHRDQAMTTYARALESSDENRLQVRLALGQLFAEEGKSADAQQQVAIGLAEARVAPVDVTTAEDYLNAASIMMGIHEYQLAQRMYGRAQGLGADETSVAVGMANSELALGETKNAQLQLASLSGDPDAKNSYEYLVSQGNVYRQLGKNDLALENFVRASQIDPQDPGIRLAVVQLSEEEGRPLIDHLGMNSGVRVNPVFEDENIYQLDARLLNLPPNSAVLPLPRRTIETYADSRFLFRPNSFPVIQGFVAERNAQGSLSFPSQLLIQNRNTFDTIFNVSVGPMFQIGDVKVNVVPGLQYTIRRDTLTPTFLNQNLFRQFVYVSTSPIFDWLSFSGNLIREAGPFTQEALHSRDFSGAVDFRVGRPWGKTALVSGYSGRNLLFKPSASTDYRAYTEFYETISYAGLERQFGTHIKATAVAEFLRAWRIEKLQYAMGQTLRPRLGLEAKFRERWSLSASAAWSSGRNFHAYDNISSSVLATYTREQGWRRNSDAETATVTHPLQFSFGLGQQSFYNFNGQNRTQVVPMAQFNF